MNATALRSRGVRQSSRLLAAALFAALFLAGLQGPAAHAGMPEPPGSAAIRTIMDSAIARDRLEGQTPQIEMLWVSEVSKAKPADFQLEVTAGQERRINAVCMPGCGPPAIRVTDPAGTAVAGLPGAAITQVILRSPNAAAFSVTVGVPQCPAQTCSVGVWVMGQ